MFTFGKYTETTSPGLRWHLPFPIEAQEIVNLSAGAHGRGRLPQHAKNKVPKESLMLTDDENIIDIQFAVQYMLKDPMDYLFNNSSPTRPCVQVAETAIREVVGKSKMDFVLYEGREQIASEAQKLMQEILDRYKTGIAISKVTMQNAQPPEQVQAAFDDAVKAGQDRERQKNEGQAYANDVVPRARGAASRLTRGGGRLSPARDRQRRGRRQPLQADPGRVRQGAGGHARAPVPRHDAAGAEQHQQDPGRPEGRRQPAVPAARQADADGGGRAAGDAGGAAPKQTLVEPAPNPDSAARSRDALRGRETGRAGR